MKFPPGFIELSRAKFQEKVEILQAQSETSLKLLRQMDIIEFKGLSKPEQYLMLKVLHNGLMFYSNCNVATKLMALGLKNNECQWFVSLDDIIKQFAIIESQGILVDKFYAIELITAHLTSKFESTLLGTFFGETVIHDEVQMTTLSQRFHKIINRRRYGMGI